MCEYMQNRIYMSMHVLQTHSCVCIPVLCTSSDSFKRRVTHLRSEPHNLLVRSVAVDTEVHGFPASELNVNHAQRCPEAWAGLVFWKGLQQKWDRSHYLPCSRDLLSAFALVTLSGVWIISCWSALNTARPISGCSVSSWDRLPGILRPLSLSYLGGCWPISGLPWFLWQSRLWTLSLVCPASTVPFGVPQRYKIQMLEHMDEPIGLRPRNPVMMLQ